MVVIYVVLTVAMSIYRKLIGHSIVGRYNRKVQ